MQQKKSAKSRGIAPLKSLTDRLRSPVPAERDKAALELRDFVEEAKEALWQAIRKHSNRNHRGTLVWTLQCFNCSEQFNELVDLALERKKGVISPFRETPLCYAPGMPRKPRFAPGNIAYHVMNRTWPGFHLFGDDADYAAFERVLAEAVQREPGIRLCAFCLMPNHFHIALWPKHDGQLSRFMQWLTMTHVQRWHAHRRTVGRGHLYQSRFRSFPVQTDEHFLSVCRYVERNALRATLCRRAENWRWGSLHCSIEKTEPMHPLLADWPVPRPRHWIRRVNEPENEKELAALRISRERGRPYGDDPWTLRTARRLGIESALNPPGRPRTKKKKGL